MHVVRSINKLIFYLYFLNCVFDSCEMGVQGLWELISPVGHPIDLDSLGNKVLAVGMCEAIFC